MIKATGIYFACNDCNGATKWAKEKVDIPADFDYADVRVKLDGIEKSFTLEDFKKRLGFEGE